MDIVDDLTLWIAGKPPRLLQKASLLVPLPGRLATTETDRTSHSKRRWKAAAPDEDLTWGVELSGDAFIDRIAAHGAFSRPVRVLEVGPGYGRLPASLLRSGYEFVSYLGVDLSETNVAHLRQRFEDEPRMTFEVADAETWDGDLEVDLVISSLTFKHIYPHFGKVLGSVARRVAPGGLVAFDLIEGRRRYFRGDTYIRWYSKAQAATLARRAGLRVLAFDEVRHTPRHSRLLVVCRREDAT